MRLVPPLATALLLTTVLVGCSSDSAPAPAPLPSSVTKESPTPTRTATATPPPMPDAAKGSSRAAAKAFVRHYIALINYAGTTGDVADLSSSSAPGCVSCNRLVNLLSRTYADGGYYRTKGWRLTALFIVPDGNQKWTAATEVHASPVRWRTSRTATSSTVPAETLQLRLEVERRGDDWTVTRMTRS